LVPNWNSGVIPVTAPTAKEKQLRPEFGHIKIYLVTGFDIPGFHIGDNDRKPKCQRDEQKVEHCGGRELQSW
jgi:hypothetical protein